jgi:hypothetical protein
MAVLQTVYLMAFTPEKLDDNSLVGMCKAATNMLSAKDRTFAQRMALLNENTRITFSNQLHLPTMHSPQTMQSTLAGWLGNENATFAPRIGDNFFPHGMRDSQGRENYVLVYFDFK